MLTNKTLGVVTALVCVAVVAAAVGYKQWQDRLHPAEVLTEVVFAPLEGAKAVAVVDAVRSAVPEFVSTTLPISTTVATLPLVSAGALARPADVATYHSMAVAGDMHPDYVPVPAARGYVVRYDNSDICQQAKICPYGVFAVVDETGKKPDVLLLSFYGTDFSWVARAGSNPDFVIQTGIPALPTMRYVWASDEGNGEYVSGVQ